MTFYVGHFQRERSNSREGIRAIVSVLTYLLYLILNVDPCTARSIQEVGSIEFYLHSRADAPLQSPK